MAKKIMLLRHAQAEPASPEQSDLERPLTRRGTMQAGAMGQWLSAHQLLPDQILCSPAQRARQTLEGVSLKMKGTHLPVQFVDGIYGASPGELLAIVDESCHDNAHLLLVGHNPGLEHLVALLCQGRSEGFRGMPSATLAHIEVEGALEPGVGQLLDFYSA